MDKHREWLKNIRTMARDDLHLANVMLDTIPDGAPSLAKGTDILPPATSTETVKVPDTRPNVDEIETLLREGNKILAIKAFRDRTGMGLKESKEVFDNWCGKVGLPLDLKTKPLRVLLYGEVAQT